MKLKILMKTVLNLLFHSFRLKFIFFFLNKFGLPNTPAFYTYKAYIETKIPSNNKFNYILSQNWIDKIYFLIFSQILRNPIK